MHIKLFITKCIFFGRPLGGRPFFMLWYFCASGGACVVFSHKNKPRVLTIYLQINSCFGIDKALFWG